MIIDWASKTMVYEVLSQYYVNQRSIIFIVDSVFDGIWYQNKANQFIHEQFQSLRKEDYFGLIKLSKNFK